MAEVFDGIDERLAEWIAAQPLFFVATAPMSADGHVNCSPKGLPGTFAVLDENEVAYLDLTGSGAETIAHVKENGRARVVEAGSAEFSQLADRFADYLGARSIVRIAVDRVSDSCGYGVPAMEFVRERENLPLDHAKRGADGLETYRQDNNTVSLDGLPALP